MKYVLIFWGIPVGSLALWYGLSINDIHFGSVYLSRYFNDLVFQVYGNILGIDPEQIRGSLMRIILLDSVFVFALAYFRPFRRLRDWWHTYKASKAGMQKLDGIPTNTVEPVAEQIGYSYEAGILPFNEKSLSRAP